MYQLENGEVFSTRVEAEKAQKTYWEKERKLYFITKIQVLESTFAGVCLCSRERKFSRLLVDALNVHFRLTRRGNYYEQRYD